MRRFPFFLLALLGPGCAQLQYKLAVSSTAEVLRRGATSLEMEPDLKLARDALPGTLKTIDSFLAAAPTQPVFLTLTAQGYTQYAFGFLEDDLEELGSRDTPERRALVERITGLYDRATEVGVRLAEVDKKGLGVAMKKDLGAVEGELKRLGKKAAPGLYWAGLAMASAINLHRDDVDRVAELPKARALLERAYVLDSSYATHGPALALGVMLAAQGKAVGGDPERAKKLFEEVIAATGGRYLMAKVLYARFYGAVTLDRELFDAQLKNVLGTPASVWPEQRLANELARRRAARYVKQGDDLF